MPFDYSVRQMKAKRQTMKNTEVFAVLFFIKLMAHKSILINV